MAAERPAFALALEVDPLTQTDDVVRLVREVLGTNVIGLYLHGSAVLGGLRPLSDIDVFGVSIRTLTLEERRVLVDRIMPISGSRSPGGRPVELTVAVQSEVRPWRYPPQADFQYGEWLRSEYERGELPMATPSPDIAPLITMVLAGDRALFGPPPAEVLDPVPHDDLLHAILDGIPGVLADLDSDTRNVILTLARIWTTVATGTIRSKDAAADWALARLPDEHRPVLSHARAIYLGQEEEDNGEWNDHLPQVRAHAACVVREIGRVAPVGG